METTGLDKDAKIIGFSICSDLETAFYVILSEWYPETRQLIDLETINGTRAFFQSLLDSNKNLIGHNVVFDCRMIESNFKVSLINQVHTDTLILAQLLNENRKNGLKELGASLYGESAKDEQIVMKASVLTNGGKLTKDTYELYKADSELLARYGAKDSMLTLKLFYDLVPVLYEEKLDGFFYDDESMPLLRGPTYEMNTIGLRIDPDRLQVLKGTLEAENVELLAAISIEIAPHTQTFYPGTTKKNTFNVSSPQQLSWLLFHVLKNDFGSLTDTGRELCKKYGLKPPYSLKDKRDFIKFCDTSRLSYSVVKESWKYMSSDADNLKLYAHKYKWVTLLLRYFKNLKILRTYVLGISARARYNIITPDWLQHGTTSGRYSCKNPNLQNLPRDDKRVKSCIVARPSKVFVGADYAQLEPRVFASVSQDEVLLNCFSLGRDFYSVVGKDIFDKPDYSSYKNDENSFAQRFPDFRQLAKAFALATPYGTSAFHQSQILNLSKVECQHIIDTYFNLYPMVEAMMLDSHMMAKRDGVVYSLYGRPRRMPEAKDIDRLYGKDTPHAELPYEARNLLNLSMNHRVQSSAASIVNRAAIAFYKAKEGGVFTNCHIVLQVHDQLVVECLENDAKAVAAILRDCMENTTLLPGVKLVAEPFITKDLAGQK